jgi:transmembrane sensor
MKEEVKPDWDLAAKNLAGETNKIDRENLQKWEQEDPEHSHELARLDDAWTLSGNEKVLYKIDENKAWINVSSKIVNKEKKSTHRTSLRILSFPFVKMAAGFLLLAAIAAGLYMVTGKLHSSSGMMTVSNEESNALIFKLPDGSQVSLNKGAKLDYPVRLNDPTREVSLSGEAFFEVKPNPLKPFIVHTQNASVKVLGTSFNVAAYKETDEVKVVVETGKVELQPDMQGVQKVVLEKGNFGSYHSNESKADKGTNSDINYLSWKTHMIRFDETPLQKVTEVLNRTYHSEINLSGQQLKNCRFTDTFSDESLETVIKVLQKAFDLKIENRDHKILLSGKGC